MKFCISNLAQTKNETKDALVLLKKKKIRFLEYSPNLLLNNYNSAKRDSFYSVLLDGPHYTRPRNFKEESVPEVLLTGNHKKIEEWFLKQREEKTKKRRIDLWEKYRSFNNDGVENG